MSETEGLIRRGRPLRRWKDRIGEYICKRGTGRRGLEQVERRDKYKCPFDALLSSPGTKSMLMMIIIRMIHISYTDKIPHLQHWDELDE